MITFDRNSRLFSTSYRGLGRSFLIGGGRGAFGTVMSGKLYDAYRKKGLSEDEARSKTIINATAASAAGTMIGHAISDAPKILMAKNKAVRNRLINKSLKDALSDTTRISAGVALGAEKRTRDKIFKDAIRKSNK